MKSFASGTCSCCPKAAAAAAGTETDSIEELREMAVLAECAQDNNLGLGHPAAPELVHEDDPSWMEERSKGKGGQGTGGTRRLVLVLHGLESSSTAPLTKRFSSVFTRNGCGGLREVFARSLWRLCCCCRCRLLLVLSSGF